MKILFVLLILFATNSCLAQDYNIPSHDHSPYYYDNLGIYNGSNDKDLKKLKVPSHDHSPYYYGNIFSNSYKEKTENQTKTVPPVIKGMIDHCTCRELAFKNIKKFVDPKPFKLKAKDEIHGISARAGIKGVCYRDIKEGKAYFYNIFGKLSKFGIYSNSGIRPQDFPQTLSIYNKNGNFIEITYFVDIDNYFHYDKSGNLKHFCIDNLMYDSNGNYLAIRKKKYH